MTKIGSRLIIGTQRLLIPESENCWMVFEHESDPIQIKVSFTTSDDDEKSSAIKIDGQEDHAAVNFVNWSNPLGMSQNGQLTLELRAEGGPSLLWPLRG